MIDWKLKPLWLTHCIKNSFFPAWVINGQFFRLNFLKRTIYSNSIDKDHNFAVLLLQRITLSTITKKNDHMCGQLQRRKRILQRKIMANYAIKIKSEWPINVKALTKKKDQILFLRFPLAAKKKTLFLVGISDKCRSFLFCQSFTVCHILYSFKSGNFEFSSVSEYPVKKLLC
jgi:hypothetical protein